MPVMHGPDYWTTFDADIIGLAAFGFPFECVKGEKSEVYVCVCLCVCVCVCACVQSKSLSTPSYLRCVITAIVDKRVTLYSFDF